jgi:serine/threonine-protein kinase
MNQSPHAEEVRRRFLALAESSRHGGPPPDLESLVASFDEPERSELRSELESLARSVVSDGTVDHVPTVDPDQAAAATTDIGPDATTDSAPEPQAGGTMDYAPRGNGAGETMDYAGAETGRRGATVDFVYQDEPETPPRKARKKLPETPQAVAGYEILGILGRGAMGVVYKARQRGLKRLVALKMILSGDHASESELGRFRSEAEAVAQLQHPNIVQIYEVGEDDGRPFFSLEFVDGQSLDKKAAGTPMPPREAAALVRTLALAMHHAHEHGIIHRDLKPANVLLTQDGTPKIGDFGLAKRIEEDTGQTKSGTVLGTPSYMAPEQAEGRVSEVGPLSDEYSLGAILYELLTGRPPFKGSTILDTLQQIRTLEPVPPMQFQPGVPRDLETICLKCLQKDRAKRYASALEFAEDLRRFLDGEPIRARPVGAGERLWRWCKRNPRVAALAGGVMLAVAAWLVSVSLLAVILKVQKDKTDQARAEADTNAADARNQEAIAKEKKQEAENSAAEARREEAKAKATAERTVAQTVDLGSKLHTRLGGTRLAIQAAPELRQLREQLLALLRQSLVLMSQTIEGLGATRYGTSAVCMALGDLLMSIGQSQEAWKMYQQGYDAMKKLAQSEPDNDLTQANFAMTIVRLGDVPLEVDGDARTALDRYKRARDVDEAVLNRPGRQRPEWDAKKDVANTDVRLGWAHLALGQPAAARKPLEEAVQYRRDWTAAVPGWEAPDYLMESEMWLAVAFANQGDEKAAREHFAEAVRIGNDLIKKYPAKTDFKGDMGQVQGALGDALLRFGKPAEAEKNYTQALDNLQVQIASEPDNIKLQPLLAQAHERLGAVSAAAGKGPDAEKHYQEALRVRKGLWQAEPTNLVRHTAYLLALAHAGQRDEAAAELTKLGPRLAKRTPLLLQAARCYAACAGGPKKAEYTTQALAVLSEAAAAEDYKDAFTLETDPDLHALRPEPAFMKLVQQVKAR